MRERRPRLPKCCCAPARSITTSGTPAGRPPCRPRAGAAKPGPDCSASVPPSARPSWSRAAALGKAASGSRNTSRSSPSAGRGSRAGRQRCRQQGVDAQHAHRHAPAAGGGGVGVDLEHGAGDGDAGVGGHALEHGIVETGARAAQREVGFAVGRAHRGRELAQRRVVDQVHRERQRDAQAPPPSAPRRGATGGGAIRGRSAPGTASGAARRRAGAPRSQATHPECRAPRAAARGARAPRRRPNA